MSRELIEVIDEMLTYIPTEHSLIRVIKDIRESADFAPPEMQQLWWKETQSVLIEHIAPKDPDDVEALMAMDEWKKEVLMAFNPPMRKLFRD